MEQKAYCVHCRTDVAVPSSYADGDHIKCGACSTQHRVVRANDILRLVISDVTPLREALHANQRRLGVLEQDFSRARASFGLGVNGFLIGILYVVAQVGLEDKVIDRGMITTAVLISIGVGIALEAANFLFLQKRKLMAQLAEEMDQVRTDSRDLQRKIRESTVRR
jgi:hypothetical protein